MQRFPNLQTPFILPQVASAVLELDGVGGVQATTGGGVLLAPIVVTEAGSADAVATLYDGTDDTGAQIATIGLGVAGPVTMPNVAFAAGLFIKTSGTTAGTARYDFCFTGSRQ